MQYFNDTYVQSRAAFRAAAERTGARLSSYERSDLRGVEGETLSVDVAVLGRSDAVKTALVISGVHGGEAFAGSAVQVGWLRQHSGGSLPPDVSIVFIHGANPWGFSYMLRTTEANIDLNRNFRSHWPGPENVAYSELIPFLHTDKPDAAEDLRAWRAYCAYLDRNGWDIEGRAIAGQSQSPDGIFYCGTEPDWANTTFRRILNEQASRASKVGFIDFHTGVGDYGEVVHLIFAAPDSDERRRALAWWRLDGDGSSGFRAGSIPPYDGLLCGAIAQELPGARITGSVVEFGTGDAFSVFRQDRFERWLRRKGGREADQPQIRAFCRDATTLRDIGWRRLVLREGGASIDRMVSGLAAWTD